MKTAKKILSIVLAVMMALGVLSVASSAVVADGGGGNLGTPETATYQGRFTLTAKITHLDGTVDTTEYTSADKISVQPGDRIEVYIYTWFNYELASGAVDTYYSADLLDAKEAGYITSTSAAQLRKAIVWNTTDNEFIADYTVASGRLHNVWSGMVDQYINNSLNWPSDWGVSSDKWHFTYTAFMTDINSWEEIPGVYLEDSSWMVHFPLKVPEDATAGTEYTITIPESTIRNRNFTGPLNFANAPGGDLIADPTIYMNEDQYIDVTKATLNLEVASAEAEIDYSALQTLYDSVKDTDTSAYTDDSVVTFTAALATASDMLTNKNAADQDAVTSVTNDLQSAFDGLTPKAAADYTELNNLIAEYDASKADLYPTDTWSAYAEAIAEGQAVVDAAYTSENQALVNDAAKKIKEAKKALSELDADYTAVKNAKASVPADLESGKYTEAAVQAVKDAINAVVEGKKKSEQAIVDGYAAAINAAVAALANNIVAGDYTPVENAIAAIPSDFGTGVYTDATEAAVTAAKNAVEYGLDASYNTQIQAWADAITAAVGKLAYKDADITALNEAIAKANAVNSVNYTEDSYKALTDAVAVGTALVERTDLTIKDQADIAAAVAAINDAYGKLVPVGADYGALNTAKAKFEALDESMYTATTWATAKAAYDEALAVADNLPASEQATVTAAAEKLENAITALSFKTADYTVLENAISAARVIVPKLTVNPKRKGVFTDESSAAVDTAIEAGQALIDAGTTIDKQADINAAADAINDAVQALVIIDYDYSNLNTIKAWYDDNNNETAKANYDAELWTVFETSLATVDWTYNTAATPETAYTLKTALKAADTQVTSDWEALKASYSAPLNFDALNAAIAEADNVDRTLYTDASLEALDSALADANAALQATTQDEIDDATDALVAAIAALAEKADYSDLNDQIAIAEGLNAADYTAATWADLETALTAAKAVDADLDASKQSVIDTAAANLAAAIAALDTPADYTALDEQIAAANALDSTKYTTDSWARVESALAAANAVDRNLGSKSQATVTNAANALKNAIAALAEISDTSSVNEISYTPSTSTVNDFNFKIDTTNGRNRVAKIQIIEEDGGTRTYDRYNSKVSIVSYDADGNVVNDLSRAKAYEIWTIKGINLPAGRNYSATAIYQDYTRETYDEGYKFTVQLKCDDAEVYEVAFENAEGTSQWTPATVTTGLDVTGIRFVAPNGGTQTYYAASAAKEADGKLVYSMAKIWATQNGENTFTVMAQIAGEWQTVGTYTYTWNA